MQTDRLLVRWIKHRDKLYHGARPSQNNLAFQTTCQMYINFCNNLLKKYSKEIWKHMQNDIYTSKHRDSILSLLDTTGYTLPLLSANKINKFCKRW